MPKLLQINTTLNWGSTGRIAEQIAMKASDFGWNCFHAYGGRYVGMSQFPAIKISSKIDNYVHAFMGEYLGRHGLGSTAFTKKFIERIKEINPDIVHLHNIHGYYLNYQELFEFLAVANIPVVWTLHDCWAFTGHCTHFDNANCDKWKTGCGQCPLLMAQYKSRIFDRSHENYQIKKSLYQKLTNVTIVPVSQWLGNLVSQSILGRFPISIIHNGIDINVFKPVLNEIRTKYGINNEKKIILGVAGSGFDDEKGKAEFIKLAQYDTFQVVLVGMNKQEAKGLPKNIIIIERTGNQRELAELYTAADVFINPTYNDTFPTTNLEALACGTPVITYRTGGSPEAIDEKTGIVVDKGDIKGLVDAVDFVEKRGKHFYTLACRERAEKYFDKDERFMDYINLYERLLNK